MASAIRDQTGQSSDPAATLGRCSALDDEITSANEIELLWEDHDATTLLECVQLCIGELARRVVGRCGRSDRKQRRRNEHYLNLDALPLLKSCGETHAKLGHGASDKQSMPT